MLNFNRLLLTWKRVSTRLLCMGLAFPLILSSLKANSEVQSTPFKPSPFTISFTPSFFNGFNISCNGLADGSIDMTILGGTPPFSISWSNGDTIEDIGSLVAGTYVVTVTDSDGTSLTDSIALIEPIAISLFGVPTDLSCFSGTDGAIDITVSNGAGGFTFLWSTAETTEDIINLPANIYSVTVTDLNLCTDTASFLLQEPLQLSISSAIDSVNCFGGNDGAISITMSGGKPTYDFLWNDGITTEDRTGLTAATYTVTVTDQNSCTTLQSFIVRQPLLLSASIVKINATCGNNNGSATANHSGGTGGVTYLWSTSATTQTITNLAPGVYTVTITDINGCTDVSLSTINNITSPAITAFVVDSASCFGVSDGAINITVTGGTPLYSFLWNDGITTEDRIGLAAATYTVTVTDQNGCTDLQSFNVLQPIILFASIVKVDAACGNNNGSATANHTGGTGGIAYLWSNSSTSQTISGLSPNTYTVTIRDINGCTDTTSTTIVNANGPSISTAILDSVSCFGGNDGAINITVSGGAPTYNFFWNDGITTEDRTGLTATAYTVKITDQNSCSIVQTFNVLQPLLLSASIVKINATCGNNNGSATANHSGGTGGVTYLWSTSATTQTLSNLAPGVFTVTVTDVSGCTDVSLTTINNITSPSITAFVVDSVNCFGGSDGAINITVTGGTPIYSFLWNDGITTEDRTGLIAATYTVTVADQNGCTVLQSFNVRQPVILSASIVKVNATCGSNNGSATANHTGGTGGVTFLWSNSSTSQTITGLAPNTYTVTIADINGCTDTSITTIVNANGPSISSAIVDSVNCFGGNDGAINITVSSGAPTYIFLWNNGSTTEDRTGLAVGTFTVTVTDQNSCTALQSFNVRQPLQLTASVSKTNATCGNNNGSATANHSGGTGGVTYLWNTSATTQTISNLATGVFTVTVTDVNGCTDVSLTTIINIAGPSITAFVVDSVNCFGGSDGAINITAAGGTPIYSFLWNDGITTEDRTVLIAATYTVTVTDQNGCTALQSFNVRQPVILSPSIVEVNATCGNNNGSATANHTGGTGGVTYLWSNSSTSQTITGLSPNTYTVTVSDVNGCTDTDFTVIINAGSPAITSFIVDSVNCFGGNDGAINITVTGGAPIYVFLWNDGITTEDRTGLTIGAFTVTVTDQNSCTAIQSFTISQPLQLTASITKVNETCGFSNGSATANYLGGTGGVTYLWNTAASTQIITGLSANNYSVTISDINNCTATASTNIININGPSITTAVVDSVNCFGGNDGSINITVTGGTPNYGFLWNDGITTEDRTGLSTGTYTVTVTDLNSCSVIRVYTVFQPLQLTASIIKIDPTCGLNNGGATANNVGGTGGVTYLWSNSSTSQTIINVAANTYTVTVTDQNSCTASVFTTLVNAGVPVISSSVVDSVNCFGGNDGSINITVNGGSPTYNYLWNDGITTEDRTGLSANTYTVTITDQNSCTASQSFIVRQPLLLTVSITKTDATCGSNNGIATANPSGGTGGITYLWNTSAISQTISNLPVNTYTVTITDINGCVASTTANINNLNGPAITSSLVDSVICFGQSNGNINITVAGGLPTYIFLWNDGNINEDRINITAGVYTVTITDQNSCTTVQVFNVGQPLQLTVNITKNNATCGINNGSQTANAFGGTGAVTYLWSNSLVSQTIINLSANTYTVTVTDKRSCSASSFETIINTGSPAITSSLVDSVKCFGGNDGSINIFVNGGVPTYNFLWSDGNTSQNRLSLFAGTYTVTIKDQNNCTTTQAFNVYEPLLLSVTITSTPSTCGNSNGSATAVPSGGAGGVTYLWNTSSISPTIFGLAGSFYTVTVTDKNSCTAIKSASVQSFSSVFLSIVNVKNVDCFGDTTGSIDISVSNGTSPFTYSWSNALITQDISNIAAGNYSVIVLDSVGCKDTMQIAISQSTQIDFIETVTSSVCGSATGSIAALITGGIAPYNYNWSNGQSTSSINNIFAGTYTLTVTDSLGCSRSTPIGVGNVDGPQVSLISHQMNNCFGGSNGNIVVNVTSGTSPYHFLWSNGDTIQNIVNLPAGIYQLTVSDQNGCLGVFKDTVTEPSPISCSAILSNATCFQPNGSIIITPSGGTPIYSYFWSNGVSSSTNALIYADTIYYLTITDANSCTFDTSFSVSNTGTPVINLVLKNNVSCFGLSDGAIDIDVTGGVAPYSYLWSGQLQVTQDLLNIPVGVYEVLVVDTTGCSSIANYEITGPTDINISFPQLNNTNCNQSNGSIITTVSGGIPSYVYLWSNGFQNDSIFNLDAGSYTLTVTDDNGCTKSAIANISDIGGPIITSVDSVLVSCPGGSNGYINVTSAGGIAPLSISWTNISSNSPSINNLPANIYTITIADAANCIVVRSIEITDPPDFVINTTLSQNNPPYNLTCFQSGDGAIDISVTGGTQPYLYIWSTGSNNEDLINLTAGQYAIVIKDSNACEFSDTFNLTEPPKITAYAGSDITICGQSYYTLNADSPVYGNGKWQIINGNGLINIIDSTYFATYVDSLQQNDNIFSWTVSDGKCSSSDEVVITVRSEVTAFAGADKPDLCGNEYTLTGTIQQTGIDIKYYWTVLGGDGVINDSSKANAVVSGLSEGLNVLVWTYINGACTGLDTLIVNKLDSIECLAQVEIPSAFSPNGDGHNDYFFIKGISDYINNKLIIFDRWGGEVFSKRGYFNEWKGDNNSGNMLPDATYFYILTIEGSDKIYKGFVDLRR